MGAVCAHPAVSSPSARQVKPVGALCFAGLQAVLDKHLDARRLLLELACKKHSEQPFPSIVVEEARGVVKRILKEHGALLD